MPVSCFISTCKEQSIDQLIDRGVSSTNFKSRVFITLVSKRRTASNSFKSELTLHQFKAYTTRTPSII